MSEAKNMVFDNYENMTEEEIEKMLNDLEKRIINESSDLNRKSSQSARVKINWAESNKVFIPDSYERIV